MYIVHPGRSEVRFEANEDVREADFANAAYLRLTQAWHTQVLNFADR